MVTPNTNPVVAQANDDSLWNTEPAVAKAAVVGLVTSILVALGAFGLVSEEQRTAIVQAVGEVTYYLFVLLPLLASVAAGIWTRLSVWSPRSAARLAIENAQRTTPTLDI